MNLSTLITQIKIDLGIYAIALPLKNLDASIAEIIKGTTLRTYSQYFPQYTTMHIPGEKISNVTRNLEYVDIILEIPRDHEIVFIADVYYDTADTSGLGYYGAGVPLHSPNLLPDLLTTNIGTNTMNMIIPKLTWNFSSPNQLSLYQFFGGSIFVKYAKLHDLSLSSIPFSQEETFTRLAVLDTKKALYNVIKHFNPIETAHGRIDLKIDDWQEAPGERKEILREWDDSFHLEQKQIYFV